MRNELGYYIRLSHADDDLGEDQYESDSITNQRELIHRYLAAHPEFSGWKIHEFVDDGYSGTSENRPEFQRMINLARHGQIRCIIVKDFSRFARNYITMGDYLEQIFPFLGIRFVSINDGYDSAVTTNITDNMSMILKSILNSYYSRDLSAKMFSCNTQRMKNGSFTGSPCFGYRMNPERTHFIIDPYAAKIVREIFDLALAGSSRPEIVRILNNAGYPTPAEYNRQQGYGKSDMVTNMPLWDHIKVSNILRQEAYTGKLIMRKYVPVAPCAKQRRRTAPEERIIRENAHAPIVTQEEFDRVQILFPKRKGWDRKDQRQYPLKGLVRCGTCGKVMPLRNYAASGAFQCQESLIEHSICSQKLYPMQEIEQAVFQALHPMLQLLIQEERKYSRRQREKRLLQCQENMSDLLREKDHLKQLKTKCYEAYVSGDLTLEEYTRQKSAYTQVGQELAQKIEALESQQNMLSLSPVPADLQQAADNAREFIHADALSREMAACFVQCVLLHEDHIEIQWKFKDLFESFTSGRPRKGVSP